MAQTRIVEVDFYEFETALRKAKDAGQRIEKQDKQQWLTYVRKHNVPEAAMLKRGQSRGLSDDIQAVIIDGSDSWDGYYVYSSEEQFSLKFIV